LPNDKARRSRCPYGAGLSALLLFSQVFGCHPASHGSLSSFRAAATRDLSCKVRSAGSPAPYAASV
jgi:hypothetical protein